VTRGGDGRGKAGWSRTNDTDVALTYAWVHSYEQLPRG
jgi:hypothetical protein